MTSLAVLWRMNEWDRRDLAIRELPLMIKVTIERQFGVGAFVLRPLSDRNYELVQMTNMYDHSGSMLVYDWEVEDVLGDYRHTNAFYDGEVNENGVFMMDSWTYRHMVGGQVG